MSIDCKTHPLDVFLLGRSHFADALALQRKLVYDAEEEQRAYLVLCEHPPLISIGRSGSRAHIKPDEDELNRIGLERVWVNRGGGCVLHLPGQIAGYAVVPLEPLGMTLGAYVEALHDVLIETLAEFDLSGKRVEGAGGVFIGKERTATVGVAVNRWIAYHGFILNVGPYLAPLRLLDEPGPSGERLAQTSMEAKRGRPAPDAKVRESLIRSLSARLGLEHQNIFTRHPLVGRKVRPNAAFAATRS